MRYWASAGFLVAIVAANVATSRYGLVPVGFGLVATAGTYFAGLCFVLRDAVQDTGGRVLTLAVVAAGALLSYLVADPRIALASGVAFAVSELVDWSLYQPLRRRGYVRAALASNTGGAVVDTFLFLSIAGFPVTGPIVAGQLVAKLTVTGLVVAGVVTTRALLRNPVRV